MSHKKATNWRQQQHQNDVLARLAMSRPLSAEEAANLPPEVKAALDRVKTMSRAEVERHGGAVVVTQKGEKFLQDDPSLEAVIDEMEEAAEKQEAQCFDFAFEKYKSLMLLGQEPAFAYVLIGDRGPFTSGGKNWKDDAEKHEAGRQIADDAKKGNATATIIIADASTSFGPGRPSQNPDRQEHVMGYWIMPNGSVLCARVQEVFRKGGEDSLDITWGKISNSGPQEQLSQRMIPPWQSYDVVVAQGGRTALGTIE